MSRLALLATTLLLQSGCATADLRAADLGGPAPTTWSELNRALYAQTVTLTWEGGDVAAGARAVVVGPDSVRFVPQRSRAVRAEPVGSLLRIEARSATGEGAGMYLGGVGGALLADRILGGTEMSSTTKGFAMLSAFVAGVVLGRRAEGARPAHTVVLYERGQVGSGDDREVPEPVPPLR